MSADRIPIRHAVATDVAQILLILHANAQAPQWTRAQVLGIFDQHPAVRRVVLVSMQEEVITGFAATSCLPGMRGEAELESIAVALDKRRQGIGRALLHAAIDWAYQQGAEHLRLEVRASNAAAIALYASSGFVQIGIRRNYYTNPMEHALLMNRRAGT